MSTPHSPASKETKQAPPSPETPAAPPEVLAAFEALQLGAIGDTPVDRERPDAAILAE